jgi:hypothetical protein
MKKLLLLLGCFVVITACQNSTTQSAPMTVTPTLSPTVTLTMSPSFTPTPTLTPTPVPLFFTDDFTSDLGAWISFQTGGAESPKVGLENGFLRVDFSSPNIWYYAIHDAHAYQNISVSTKFSGTPSGSIGVICDYNEGHGWYEFNIASDGTYNVLFGQWLTLGVAQYTPIATDASEYLKAGKLDYEIGLTCQDNTLLLHINGKLFRKLNVTRFGLDKGRTGITASSFDEVPMIATFDWFKAEEPGE